MKTQHKGHAKRIVHSVLFSILGYVIALAIGAVIGWFCQPSVKLVFQAPVSQAPAQADCLEAKF